MVRGAVIALALVACLVLLARLDVPSPSVKDLKTRTRMHGLGQAIVLWADSNDGTPPRVEAWASTLTLNNLASEELFDSLRIKSEPGATAGSELIYSPLVNGDGTLAPLMEYPIGGLGWIIVREDGSRVPESKGVVCVTIEGGVPFTMEVDRETLARLLESQEKAQGEWESGRVR
jgi:hypothetical protein